MLTIYTINKAVNEKKLTSTQLGKTRYYRKKDIENFLNSNKKEAYRLRNFNI